MKPDLEDAEREVDVASIPPFSLDSCTLQGGWTAVVHEPALRLVLTQAAGSQGSVARRAGTVVVALLISGFLIAGARAQGDLRLFAYPLAALFGGVAVLGVASLLRVLRLGRPGLVLDARALVVEGCPEASADPRATLRDLSAQRCVAPLANVERVRLRIHREPRDAARAELAVELKGGLSLQGPFTLAPDAQWEEARDALLPLAMEAARVSRQGLVIEHAAERTTQEISAAVVQARGDGLKQR